MNNKILFGFSVYLRASTLHCFGSLLWCFSCGILNSYRLLCWDDFRCCSLTLSHTKFQFDLMLQKKKRFKDVYKDIYTCDFFLGLVFVKFGFCSFVIRFFFFNALITKRKNEEKNTTTTSTPSSSINISNWLRNKGGSSCLHQHNTSRFQFNGPAMGETLKTI